jgi:hypothetical protein
MLGGNESCGKLKSGKAGIRTRGRVLALQLLIPPTAGLQPINKSSVLRLAKITFFNFLES